MNSGFQECIENHQPIFRTFHNSQNLSTMCESQVKLYIYNLASLYSLRHHSIRCHYELADGPSSPIIQPGPLPSSHTAVSFPDQESAVNPKPRRTRQSPAIHCSNRCLSMCQNIPNLFSTLHLQICRTFSFNYP